MTTHTQIYKKLSFKIKTFLLTVHKLQLNSQHILKEKFKKNTGARFINKIK